MKTLTKLICILILSLVLVLPAQAARLFTSGFELNSTVAGVEFDTTTSPAIIINTSIGRTGTYALEAAGGYASRFVERTFTALTTGHTQYYRCYIKIATPVNKSVQFMAGYNSGGTLGWFVTLETDNTVKLRKWSDNSAIGSASAALTGALDGGWDCVEVAYTYSGTISARINQGTPFVSSGTGDTNGAINTLQVGGDSYGGGTWTGDYYLDDLAVNDDSGSYQNSYPGSGKVLMLHPSATGDNNQWLNTTGGAGASTDWSLVNDVTPDNATSFIKCLDSAVNKESLFNCTNSGIASYDIVNAVEVGCRFTGAGASLNSSFKVEVEKTASGTKTQSAAITPANTTWHTNTGAAPFTSPIITYLNPDGAAWTQATLDSMQIGVLCTATSTNYAQVSTLWAMVDYTPGSASTNLTVDGSKASAVDGSAYSAVDGSTKP